MYICKLVSVSENEVDGCTLINLTPDELKKLLPPLGARGKYRCGLQALTSTAGTSLGSFSVGSFAVEDTGRDQVIVTDTSRFGWLVLGLTAL